MSSTTARRLLCFGIALGLVTTAWAQSVPPLTQKTSPNRVGINNANPAFTLDVTGTANATAFRGDGSQLTGIAGMAGSGTVNRIPKFTGTTALGNSVITEVNGSVGVGTTTPNLYGRSRALTFSAGATGMLELQGSTTSPGNAVIGLGAFNGATNIGLIDFGADVTGIDAGRMVFYTSPTGGSIAGRMTIDSIGNVGIGTSSPVGRLTIYGAPGDDRGAAATLVSSTTLNKWTMRNEDANLRFEFNPTNTPGGATKMTVGSDGTLTATTKNFAISHPTNPGHTLVHSVLEGPEVGVYYRGEARLADGEAVVTLPPYFEALTRKDQRTVQLTPIGASTVLYVLDDVREGRFTVRTDAGNPRQRFYWEVKAVRADVAPLVVEQRTR